MRLSTKFGKKNIKEKFKHEIYKKEFDKHDKKMMNNVAELEQLVEWAQQDNTAFTEIDGVKYGSAHLWREVAEKALDLANQQEWFDRYEDME